MLASKFAPLLISCLGLMGLFSAPSLSAQDFPNRPITLIMPYAPGGPGDAITRLFAGAMQKTLGQQVVVDNPAGASGSIGSARVARSKPDGYTLLMIHVSHATNLVMFKSLPYHPVNDFEPIGRATLGPMLVVARNGFPSRDLNEWLAYVKANAPKVSLAHAGVGSASHLCGLMLMNALGVKFNEIPYKGTGPALNDLAGGQVDLLCDQTSGTVPLIKAGRIRAIAAAGPQRIGSVPDMPAIGEAGVAGMDINISFGMYAPKGTPKAEIDKLSKALQTAVTDPEVKGKLETMGVNAVGPELARPEALRAHLQREIDVLGGLLVKAGVKPE
jgi:tripartite-type tricarboxylate transporter receptor subunit TctC